MKTEGKTEYERFDAALDQIMSVSHDELKLREAEWKRQKEANGRKAVALEETSTMGETFIFCLNLAEEYLEFCSNYRLEHAHEGCETEVPSFCQFLDGRGYNEFSNLVRKHSELPDEERPSRSEFDGSI